MTLDPHQQQQPCALTTPVAGFQVELIDPDNLIYEIRNINADAALSNWILELDACGFVNCFVSEVFEIGSEPPDPDMPGICEFPSQNNEQFACPPEDLGCAGVITGLKFDELDNFGELSAGFAQRFRIVLDSAFELAPACFQLKFGNEGRCGQICAPVCVEDPCDNPCPCEEPKVFQCTMDLPSCGTFTGDEGDIRVGFCIGTFSCERTGETCEASAIANVCGQEIECCVPVQPWLQSVDLEIVFNAPLTTSLEACQDQGQILFACCFANGTFTKLCFTCADEETPPCTTPTCENVSVTPIDTEVFTNPLTGITSLTIFYTVIYLIVEI